MPLPELALALAGLLVAPGPTNTLLALAGAERGASAALRLLPAVLVAYLAVTVPLALAGGSLLAVSPWLKAAVALAAAGWVAFLAFGLWRDPRASADVPPISAARLAVTTLLNPKGLVIGLALLPSEQPLLPRLFLLAVLVIASGGMWALAGGVLLGWRRWALFRKLGAIWLAVLAAGLAAAGLAS